MEQNKYTQEFTHSFSSCLLQFYALKLLKHDLERCHIHPAVSMNNVMNHEQGQLVEKSIKRITSPLVKSKPRWLCPAELKFKVQDLLIHCHDCGNYIFLLYKYWLNNHSKHADGNVSLFLRFSSHLVSSVWFPFNIYDLIQCNILNSLRPDITTLVDWA